MQLSQELDKLRESIGKQRKEGEKLWSMLADIGGKVKTLRNIKSMKLDNIENLYIYMCVYICVGVWI